MKLHEPITLSPAAFDELRVQLKERSKSSVTLWEDQQVTMGQPGNPVGDLIPCVIYFKSHRDLSAFIIDAQARFPGVIVKRQPM